MSIAEIYVFGIPSIGPEDQHDNSLLGEDWREKQKCDVNLHYHAF